MVTIEVNRDMFAFKFIALSSSLFVIVCCFISLLIGCYSEVPVFSATVFQVTPSLVE